jgi:Tfp pilus assembly protein PilF
LLLAGILAFEYQHRRSSMGSGPVPAQATILAGGQNEPFPLPADQRGAGPALTTNRPGAAMNREAEGQAADLSNEAARLLNAGDAKKAITIFERALALTPKDETVHFNLGHAFVAVGDFTNAEHEYQQALHILPDYPEAHNNYGNLLVRLGRLSEAQTQLVEAVNQLPEAADFQNNLGVLWQRRKETNAALLCFQKAIECDSNYWQAHFNLAVASLGQNNREKGIAELRETLRLKPGYQPALRVLERLNGQGAGNSALDGAAPQTVSNVTVKP